MSWQETFFDERQRGLIQNCQDYARGEPAGLPGHSLMLLVARMADLLDEVAGGATNAGDRMSPRSAGGGDQCRGAFRVTMERWGR